MVKGFYKIESFCSKLFSGKMNSLCWHTIKIILNAYAPIYYRFTSIKDSKSCKELIDKEVIISLTTFPGRIKTLPLVLESLCRQTIKPTRIILWLADEQFPQKELVDNIIHKYLKYGLVVRYCDDLRAHKKYYYAIKENPDALIVTYDDDIFAPEDMLERLLLTYKKHPDCIITNRAHEMKFDNDGKLLPYSQWNHLAKNCIGPSLLLCATGGAGCLYSAEALSEKAFDKELIKSLCYYADDIWLKCMSYINGTRVVLTGVDNPEIIDVKNNKQNGLAKQNVEKNLNDVQLEAISEYFHIEWSEK